MLTATSGLSRLRSCYCDETRALFGTLLNCTSAAEANIALDLLRGSVPEKALVTACNLREVLKELPSSPFTMSADEETLCRTARFEKRIAVLEKTLPDGIELVLPTLGNLVLDLIVRRGAEKYYWTPIPVEHDFVNPSVVDLVITSDCLLEEVIELVKCMGVVFNAKFYLSVEDFLEENAADVFGAMDDLFGAAQKIVSSHPAGALHPDPLT
jgi:hypothetical protein